MYCHNSRRPKPEVHDRAIGWSLGRSSLSCRSLRRSSTSFFRSLSTLVATTTAGKPLNVRKSSSWASASCGSLCASTNSTTSLSDSRCPKYLSMLFFHWSCMSLETLAYPYPGKSVIVQTFPTWNRLMSLVRPGVLDTVAIFFLRPDRRLSAEDLPTFDRPANVISGNFANLGISLGSGKPPRKVTPCSSATRCQLIAIDG
mmetsp:Transcript_7249/g.12254  ORF Transcript_7249/g.12254 Transcript_7249/m.12254 type:complete len:201 (+) Transcript_7249:334-936(+)